MIATDSIWRKTSIGKFPRLTKSASYDVVVIGGGLTGVSAAYQLKQAGKRVCLLERNRLGFVDTGNTTAHLTYVTDLRISQLAKVFGKQAAAQVWEAGAVAIDAIEKNVRDLKIECDFRRVPGYLVAALQGTKNETKQLQQDAELAAELGFPARFQERAPFFDRPGIQFPDQGLFHPYKYLAGLAAAIPGEGSAIFEQAEVEEITDDPLTVKAAGHELQTKYVVIATHVPLMGKTGLASATLFQTKLYPYTSYALGAKTPRGAAPAASFWDTSDPYYYLRVEPGKTKDYVIFGGEDHKTGQEEDTRARFDKLAAVLHEFLPEAEIDRQWSGQVIETADGLPYIGETAENQFVATGFSGNGMTFGTLAGLMARDAMLKRDNPWAKLFSVSRKKLRGGLWNFLSENIDYPYYYLKDRISGSAGNSTRLVKRGEGKILDHDGQKVACSRDEQGKVHSVSAYCTHMGCLVRWNDAEKSWDCPCHGSRFKPDGKVIAGPAETPLDPIEKSAELKSAEPAKSNAAEQKSQPATKRTAKKPAKS